MRGLLLLFFFPQLLFAQEAKLTIKSEERVSDSITIQIVELAIYNNKLDPICIRISPSFLGIDLSKDTVELVKFDGNGCLRYDLLHTVKGDLGIVENFPRYPLILNGLTSFITQLKVERKSNCNGRWLEFWYFDLYEYECNILVKKFQNGQRWDSDPKLKYTVKKIIF